MEFPLTIIRFRKVLKFRTKTKTKNKEKQQLVLIFFRIQQNSEFLITKCPYRSEYIKIGFTFQLKKKPY